MTDQKPQPAPREWWVDYLSDMWECQSNAEKDAVHVIEYSAYAKLQAQLEEMRLKSLQTISALGKINVEYLKERDQLRQKLAIAREALADLLCGTSITVETDPAYADMHTARIDKDDLAKARAALEKLDKSK